MTKAELIDRIARSRDLPPDVTKKCIAAILDTAFDELGTYFARARVTRASNPRFTYPGFGTFTKKKRAARRGVNPRTLKPMDIDASCTVDFRPGAELKRTMNSGKGTKASRGKRSRKANAAKATPAKRDAGKRARRGEGVAGPSGRRLVSREEAELQVDYEDDFELPDAPIQRVRRSGGSDVEDTG